MLYEVITVSTLFAAFKQRSSSSVAAEGFRITSYNVCYTKLLRYPRAAPARMAAPVGQAAFEAEFHDGAHITVWDDNSGPDKRFPRFGDQRGIGIQGRIVDGQLLV